MLAPRRRPVFVGPSNIGIAGPSKEGRHRGVRERRNPGSAGGEEEELAGAGCGEDAARRAFAERRQLIDVEMEAPALRDLAAALHDGTQLAGALVAEHVGAVERGDGLAAIDVA